MLSLLHPEQLPQGMHCCNHQVYWLNVPILILGGELFALPKMYLKNFPAFLLIR